MIEQLSAERASAILPELVALLIDGVASGASIGFLPPLAQADAQGYWGGVVADWAQGGRILLVARQSGRVVGAVQLELAGKPNALHRAEVQKLIVHTSARRQGLGRALMVAAEAAARQAGRTLLVLDTRQGDPSEQLYQSVGYILAGVIPHYARSANGQFGGSAFYYRLLEDGKDR
jgi:acetyltransferase